MNEIRQPSPEEVQKAEEELRKPLSEEERKKPREFTPAQLFALAEALEKQGQHEQAAELRASAQKNAQAKTEQEVTNAAAFLQAVADKTPSSIPQSERNRPPVIHNPKKDAKRFGTATNAAIDKFITQQEQSNSPTAPKGQTPSGGK